MSNLTALRHLFVTVFLYNFSAFMVVPVIGDVTLAALCPGEDECSAAIYLTGFQQAVTGLGTLIAMPLIGNLSDNYGRKIMLSVPMALAVFPLGILALSRTRRFFYAYTAVKVLTDMVCEGAVHCLALAYVADKVPSDRRASAFGILSGVASAAFVCGTFMARFLPISSTFQCAAITTLVAFVYMKAFLGDSKREYSEAPCQLIKSSQWVSHSRSDPNAQLFARIISVEDLTCLLRSSLAFSQTTIVAFLTNLGESGLRASLLFYLKVQFHFSKDQFANLLLIIGIAGTTSQLLIMPILARSVGEVTLLSVGLCASWIHILLYGVSWSVWIPYVASSFSFMSVFAAPCMRSIASKLVEPDEQGKAQGCISAICAVSTIISPVVFTPLTALFLSGNAPFHFPGLSLLCISSPLMIAFIQSLMMRTMPLISSHKGVVKDAMQL